VFDESDWIELFTNGAVRRPFWALVFKWVLRKHSEAQTIQAAAVMQRGLVVDLDNPSDGKQHHPGHYTCPSGHALYAGCRFQGSPRRGTVTSYLLNVL